MGTLSKAFAVLGGYVAGSRILFEYLVNRSRPILFSTSHPPSVAASARAALAILEEDPELLETLWKNTDYFKRELSALGFDTGVSRTPITPVMIGDEHEAMKFFPQVVRMRGVRDCYCVPDRAEGYSEDSYDRDGGTQPRGTRHSIGGSG